MSAALTGVREFNFGAGNPAPESFPVKALAVAAQRVLARSGVELAHYPDHRGMPELRAIAQQRFEHAHGVRPPLEHVVITNGAMQGLQLSAQGLARPGDVVLVEEFEYVGTIRVFKQHGLELVPVALDDQGMRMDALEQVLARQQAIGRLPAFIYTTASYQNPTGTTMPRARRERLIELARTYQIRIVEDDTYADVSFEAQTEPAVYTLAQPGEVMYLASFSKILGPGARLGYLIVPEPTTSEIMLWKTDGGSSALAQMIAAEYFSEALWEHIAEAAQAVKDKRNVLLDALEAEFSDMGMHWTRPAGGLFLWVTLPEEVDRVRLQELATSRGIVYHLGRSFDPLDRDVPYLRLAFGWIDKDAIPEGIRVLAECVRGALRSSVRQS
jgi:2-aminoadipate transaminase